MVHPAPDTSGRINFINVNLSIALISKIHHFISWTFMKHVSTQGLSFIKTQGVSKPFPNILPLFDNDNLSKKYVHKKLNMLIT